MSQTQAFTGRSRRRKTRWTVRLSDVLAGTVIRIGGIGTIVAVSTVGLFLVWVVLPLFLPASLTQDAVLDVPWESHQPLAFRTDEYQLIGWALLADGTLRVFQADDGKTLETRQLFEDAELTAVSFDLDEGVAFGFADGTVRMGSIGFKTAFYEFDQVPESVQKLQAGEGTPYENGIIQRTPQGQFRLQSIDVVVGDPIEVVEGSVQRLDKVTTAADPQTDELTGARMCVVTADGSVRLVEIGQSGLPDPFGEAPLEVTQAMELPLAEGLATPEFVHLAGRGDSVFLAWPDGRLLSFDARRLDEISLVSDLDLVEDPNAKLTQLELLLGNATLIAGDSTGRMSAWFEARRQSEDPAGEEQSVLVKAHELPSGSAAVTSLGMSTRSRLVSAGFADGTVNVYNVTSEQRIVETSAGETEPITDVYIAPKEDGLYAATTNRLIRWDFDPRHPEASLAALFSRVWYEGYGKPEHTWQSSFANQDAEPKFGLTPLVFGSLKATFYSMLFGAPLALLAAVYTSEFLHPKTRSRIKPTIEIMASLPSVVLGFLAGAVFAPYVETFVPGAMACLFAVPATILLCAYLWQLLPYHTCLRWDLQRIWLMCLVVPFGILLGLTLGPVVEDLFFAGNTMRWLDGQIGTGTGAWMVLWLPLCALIVGVASARGLNPFLRNKAGDWGRNKFAQLECVKFLGLMVATIGLSLAISHSLTLLGFDPRGSYLDTYEQRNALVVGFVMGFAIIPIVYTIAEDALSSVPEHLRSASLGAGATPWQTAVNVVIPTAMSGLFSALMIGLGRAVGETMIVLMAAGNTPVMEWNMFNGFRTLSANIAVELPEAVRDSTHYRTLFLAALSLFVMTFAVNTVAEVVRLHFRRRVYEL